MPQQSKKVTIEVTTDSEEPLEKLTSPTPDKLTLEELMKSPELRTIFQAFCMKELSVENFLFVQAVENFKALKGENNRRPMAQKIYDEYLLPDSLFELNINRESAKKVQDALGENQIPENIFDELKKCIEFVMNDTLMRFTEGSDYKEYQAQQRTDSLPNVDKKSSVPNSFLLSMKRGSVTEAVGDFFTGRRRNKKKSVNEDTIKKQLQMSRNYQLKQSSGNNSARSDKRPSIFNNLLSPLSARSAGKNSPNSPSLSVNTKGNFEVNKWKDSPSSDSSPLSDRSFNSLSPKTPTIQPQTKSNQNGNGSNLDIILKKKNQIDNLKENLEKSENLSKVSIEKVLKTEEIPDNILKNSKRNGTRISKPIDISNDINTVPPPRNSRRSERRTKPRETAVYGEFKSDFKLEEYKLEESTTPSLEEFKIIDESKSMEEFKIVDDEDETNFKLEAFSFAEEPEDVLSSNKSINMVEDDSFKDSALSSPIVDFELTMNFKEAHSIGNSPDNSDEENQEEALKPKRTLGTRLSNTKLESQKFQQKIENVPKRQSRKPREIVTKNPNFEHFKLNFSIEEEEITVQKKRDSEDSLSSEDPESQKRLRRSSSE
eukprot:gene11354-4522_t